MKEHHFTFVVDVIALVIRYFLYQGWDPVMMTPEMMARLKRSLILHEGYRNFPYTDTVDKITIGIGYNLTDRGLSDEWINKQYLDDVTYFYNQLCEFPWFNELNEDRKIILIDMSFMGWKRFLGFTEMLKALAKGDYNQASVEMLNSEWATQVKGRAVKLAQGMLDGVYDV